MPGKGWQKGVLQLQLFMPFYLQLFSLISFDFVVGTETQKSCLPLLSFDTCQHQRLSNDGLLQKTCFNGKHEKTKTQHTQRKQKTTGQA